MDKSSLSNAGIYSSEGSHTKLLNFINLINTAPFHVTKTPQCRPIQVYHRMYLAFSFEF